MIEHNINYNTKLLTIPITKRLNINIKYSLCIIFIISFYHIQSQELETYKKNREFKNDSVLNSFSQKDKFKVLNILPSISYNALNNAFSVGFSLSGLSNYYQQKQRNKIEIARLKQALNENLTNDLDKLNIDIEAFKMDYQILKNQIDLFQFDFDLFQISKGKYKNSEITSEDFLKLKKDFLAKKNSLKTSVLKLRLKALKIEQKTKSDVENTSLNILNNSINNYD